MSKSKEMQRAYFSLVLKKDYDRECWTPANYQDYAATVRVYNKYHNGRTYEEFLKDMLGKSNG